MPFNARFVNPRIRRAMRILENDQGQVPSAADLATRVGLSTAHFSRLFAMQLGEPASAYGRRIRLDHSVNRLRYDPSSIGEVAQDFGYESQAAFTRAFHEQFGVSPRDYMNRNVTGKSGARLELPSGVRMVTRTPTALAARRFFGDDQGLCWRTFLAELPAELAADTAFIGLSYDDPRVTPPAHQRYDCCVLLPSVSLETVERAGLDAVELPGGLHGEVDASGDPNHLRKLFTSLFADWLPTRPGLAPEGDPLPIFFDEPPVGKVHARVAIRVRDRTAIASPNAAVIEKRADIKKSLTDGTFRHIA